MAGHAERAGLHCIREFVLHFVRYFAFRLSLFSFFFTVTYHTLHLPKFSSHA